MHQQRAISYLKPTFVGLLGYILAACIILGVLNIRPLLQAVANTQPNVSGEFSRMITEQISLYGNLPIVNWITIVLFWGVVGLGVYTLFWLGMAFLTAARNEVIVETAFSNRGHFQDKVRVPLIKLILIGGIIVSLLTTVRYGIPFGSSLFAAGLYQIFSNLPYGLMLITAAVLGGVITMYILRTLVVYFRHAEGIF